MDDLTAIALSVPQINLLGDRHDTAQFSLKGSLYGLLGS